jgi:hypothetical protein
VPCCYLFSAGVTKLVMLDSPVLVMSEDPGEFCVELNKAERPGNEPSLERRSTLVIIAGDNIK